MTAVYPTITLLYDADNDGTPETDISSRVVSDFDGQSGIMSYKDTEMLSSPGSLKFALDNSDDNYTATVTALIGKAISITLTLNYIVKQTYFGYIESAVLTSGEWGRKIVSVTITDWLNIANKTRVSGVAVDTDVTADEALTTLNSVVPNPPAHTSFDVGSETFLTMFDGSLNKAVVFSEQDKIVKSELGQMYLRHRDEASGETLVFENRLHRGSTHPLSKIPESSNSFIKVRSGGGTGYLKLRSAGGTSKAVLRKLENATFDRTMTSSEWETGQNVINQMSVSYVPKSVDASYVVLYTLPKFIRIGSTQTITIQGAYTDPTSGRFIAASDVQTPAATTDYLFNSDKEGLGTDRTANLQITFTKTPSTWKAVIKNKGNIGYLWFFQVKGKGIYRFDPVEVLTVNTESQEDIVKTEVSEYLTREYSNDFDTSKTFADGAVAIDRTPRRVMKSVSFIANTSERLMLAFMYLEQGDKIRITESQPSHAGDYYIQGVKFKISPGGIVSFTWYLKEEVVTICQPIAVRCGTNNSGNRSAIDYGILPYLANMQKFSYSMWIQGSSTDVYAALVTRSVDTGSGRRGNELSITTNGTIYFKSYRTPTDGEWIGTHAVTGTNVWRHLVLTYDTTFDTEDPILYIDGSVFAMTESLAPGGTYDDDSDCPLLLFNWMPDPATNYEYYSDWLRDVVLKDVRIYNRILTPTEVTELYAGEDDYTTVQDGLVFNGIYAPTDNIADYINDTITDQDLILDSVHRAAGTPYNEDTSAATEMLYGLSL